MTPLCTVGYEGKRPDELLEILVSNEIEVVVDVRQLPLSRKKGFSKSTLSSALGEAGLEYRHFRALGNPKHLREALKAGLAFEEFAKDFLQLLAAEDDAIDQLGEVATTYRVCLLCFEADPDRCHRSLVADYLVQRIGDELEVVHLGSAC